MMRNALTVDVEDYFQVAAFAFTTVRDILEAISTPTADAVGNFTKGECLL